MIWLCLLQFNTAETNLFNWLHHALAVVTEGEVGAVRPLLPAQLCTPGGDARGRSSDPAPPRSLVWRSEPWSSRRWRCRHRRCSWCTPSFCRWRPSPPSHVVQLTEVQLTPPEMINRNAVKFLVIKINYHLDKRGRITLKEYQSLETKCQISLADNTTWGS